MNIYGSLVRIFPCTCVLVMYFFFLLNKMLINNIYVFIVDVTPPSLRFVLNHSLTRSNASITWTVSEPVVSSNCTVTFPNGTLVYESCIDRWEAIDLRRGPYQISIVLVDTAGHIGGPFRHTWTNSIYMLIMISLSYAGLSRYIKVYTGNFQTFRISDWAISKKILN